MARRHIAYALAALVSLAAHPLSVPPASAQTEIKITKQPGLLFAPVILMEHHKLLEKHAKAQGLDIKANWIQLASGGAANDSLLSGSIDVVVSGVSNLLILWGRSNGEVKAISGVSGLPFKLLTRNPDIKTIKDYTEKDRIALPTVRMSMQAITLGIALQKAWDDPKANERLLKNQVQMGHPDALAAMLNPAHEVTSHFASSPFQEIALKQPGIRAVLDSRDALGGDAHVSLAYTTVKYADANPKLMRAWIDALDEATALLKKEPKATAELYLTVTREKATVDEIVALMTQPGAIYQTSPVRTMVYADYMWKAGFTKLEPKGWKSYFLPVLHDREGS